MKLYIFLYVVIMNLYVIKLLYHHFILSHNLWYLIFVISEWVLIKTESCHSSVVYACVCLCMHVYACVCVCVCVLLVSCVGILVFSSIIESFWMFNFLYYIFNECNFFLYAGPPNWGPCEIRSVHTSGIWNCCIFYIFL